MNKKRLILIISAIIVAIIAGIVAFVCINGNNTKSNKDNSSTENKMSEAAKLMEKAEILDWINVYNTIANDSSKAKDYNGKTYIYYGVIERINESNNSILVTNNFTTNGNPSVDGEISVFLDHITGLNEKDMVCVVGKLNITGNIYDLENAHIITSADYDDEKYYASVIKENGNYYFNYTFDDETGLPASYTKIDFSYSLDKYNKETWYKNEEKYNLKYDKNKNLTEENVTKYVNGNVDSQYTKSYKYNDDNTLASTEAVKNNGKIVKSNYTYEKNEKGQIIKENLVEEGGLSKPYTKETTYEYNEKDQVIKEVSLSSMSDNTKIKTYEYNEKGQIVSETERDSFLNTSHTYNYEYDEQGNKTKKFEDNSTKEYFIYGIVGIK